MLAWLRARTVGAMVFGGIGTGAAWLAEAGLLSGHRATVHWPHIALMAERHVDVVVSQQVYEIDRARLSCAAHHASQDMMIAWLGQRHGERVAQELVPALGLETCARARRTPARAQSRIGSAAGSAKLAEAVSLMEANLGEPLPTEDIARLVGVFAPPARTLVQTASRCAAVALVSRTAPRARAPHVCARPAIRSCRSVFLAASHRGRIFPMRIALVSAHTPRDERSQRAAAWRQTSVPGPASPAQEDA